MACDRLTLGRHDRKGGSSQECITFEPPPNFAKLAEAANGYGEQVTELSQLVPTLQRGLEHTRNHILAVIAVRVPGPMQDGSERG